MAPYDIWSKHPWLHVTGTFKTFLGCLKDAKEQVKDKNAGAKRDFDWRNSAEQKRLRQELLSGLIPDDMDADKVWERRKGYLAVSGKRHFKDCLERLRKLVKEQKECHEFDTMAFYHDRTIYPEQEFEVERNQPRWAGSVQQQLLQHDIDNDLHHEMTPKELWETDDLYQQFSLTVFRKHIYQELKCRKGKNMKKNHNISDDNIQNGYNG